MSTLARPEAVVAAINDWRALPRAHGTPETREDTRLGCLPEIRTEMLERETGFEPATFSLGS